MDLSRSGGILAHPTSFPSPYGIGDLGQGAYKFVDFLYSAKQKLWQVLPLGPTSFGDSPYQSFSTFAGNTLLISPDLLIKSGLLREDDLTDIPQFSKTEIDYGEVIIYKETLYKKAYDRFIASASHSRRSRFSAFKNDNADWLDSYSLFVSIKSFFIKERKNTWMSEEYLRFKKLNEELLDENAIDDYFYGAVWNSWPEELAKRDAGAIAEWTEKLAGDIDYVKFLQYIFFTQWKALKYYANKRDISIIGDIPIFVSMDSSDVWAAPELFHLDRRGYPTEVAGVPPDYFSETGQLWGNPLYNWDAHKAEGYSWWIKRVASALKLVDILRIDHFRGFVAYWAVEYGQKTAIEGEWRKGPGRDVFDAIEKALGHLPIIAEDLGIITEEVTELRESLGLPGMKVLQFAFDSTAANSYLPHSFENSSTVVYTGTHDNDTTAGWYEKADKKTEDYFRRYMNVSGENPSWDLIRLAYASSAMYAVTPVQDVLSLGSESRMNTPGTPSGNWQFRYTEDMLTDERAEWLAYLGELFNR